jgi:hypothetical protein
MLFLLSGVYITLSAKIKALERVKVSIQPCILNKNQRKLTVGRREAKYRTSLIPGTRLRIEML